MRFLWSDVVRRIRRLGLAKPPGAEARWVALAAAAAVLLSTLFQILGPMLEDFHNLRLFTTGTSRRRIATSPCSA